MKIMAFRIDAANNIPFETGSSTLDEMTRELPQGFYTTFSTLARGTKVLGLSMHLGRLYGPASEQGIIPSVDEFVLRARIAELTRLNPAGESRIRLILTKDRGLIYAGIQPFEPLAKTVYENGVKVITADLVRQPPRVKDTGFISSSIDQRGKVTRDVFEVLLTKNGKIFEGMTSNFYVIKANTLVTAQRGILLGITRKAILGLARGQGMQIEYRCPTENEKINEAFLTSSSRGIVPIISIDNKPVGQGRVGKWTEMLSKAYQAYVEERSEKIVE